MGCVSSAKRAACTRTCAVVTVVYVCGDGRHICVHERAALEQQVEQGGAGAG